MAKINPLIFRAYDIRGIAMSTSEVDKQRNPPELDLTPKTANLIGRGTATYLKRAYGVRNMLVGRDNRLHSENLHEAFIQGVLATGVDVTDVGLSTSPLIYYGVCKFGFDSGVNITASHNPKQYNGIKIVGQNAHSICGDELQKILKIIENDDFETAIDKTNTNKKPHTSQKTFNNKTSTDSNTATPARTRTNTSNGTAKSITTTTTIAGATINTAPLTTATTTSAILTKKTDNFQTYLADIASRVKIARKMKVVVDAGNGTAGIFAPDLIKAIGCEVIPLYCEPDGNFPNHEANPEEEKNMKDLSEAVLRHHADLGIGFDGDGDRVGIVDEKGRHYSADYLLILLARELLENRPKSQIVFDVKVSRILIDEITRLGGVPVMSRTGHSFIETRMHELNAPLAGEISGHLFFGKDFYNYYGFDDATFAACKIVEIISKSNKTFSAHFNDLPKMATTPEFKAHCPDDRKFEIVKDLTSHFKQLYDCVTIDGVRVNFDDKSWGAVRCSNTSPNLTLRFEAPNQKRLSEIQAIMAEELKKYPEVSLDWYRP
jgi:phosphomannomutase